METRRFLVKQATVFLLLTAIVALTAASAPAASPPPAAESPLGKAPTWHPPKVEDVKLQVMSWIDKSRLDEAARAKASSLWAGVTDQTPGTELLIRMADTFALAEPQAAKLVELCSKPRDQAVLPGQPWLTDAKTPPLVANNMKLYFARWLVQNAMYDEALELIAAMAPGDVAAPADLLFYQGVVHHRLLHRDDGLKAIDQLLDGAEGSPRRYVVVARLMQADLTGLEPDTLDHIARRMGDIERRLDLGRAGPKVRKIEDDVIESLDKLIKKLQDQQDQQAAAAGGGGSRSSSPAPKSAPLGARGPGEVTKRNIGSRSGWGDLPPKEREEALQQVGRDFPPHYRDIIEQYFRRLAAEESKENK
jgi:hypothetical protein